MKKRLPKKVARGSHLVTSSTGGPSGKPPRVVHFNDLPRSVKTVAIWAMTQFAERGTWPTQPEAIVECYDRRVHQDILSRNAGSVFQPRHLGSEPALINISSWVMSDSGLFTGAFDMAERVFRAALIEVRNTKGPVSWTKAEVASRFALDTANLALTHVEYILGKASLLYESSPDEWRLSVQLHHLTYPEPTKDELFVVRPRDYGTQVGTSTASGAPVIRGLVGAGKRTAWVFVGSTWLDLGDSYRPKVLNALLSQRMLPLGMEQWPSGTQQSIDRSLQELASADLAIFVIGERFGSPPYKGDPRSFTEVEYDTAVSRGLDVICFLSADDAEWKGTVLDPKNARRQKAFRDKILAGRHVRRFSAPEDLETAVVKAIVEWDRGALLESQAAEILVR